MREILFRAKAINREPDQNYRTKYKNGDWVYGLVERLPIIKNGEKFLDKDCAQMRNAYGVNGIDVDENTICEFTGLTDKNGTKIFEGDIVKLTDKNNNYEWIAVVEFGNPNSYYSWGWQLKPITKNVEYNLDILCWVDIDDFGIYCEVIGNIYDNPELLRSAK